jgi:uncharacterized protein YdaU (DUF1376 family)
VTKAPAFQFYPGDFISGAVGMMTPEEVGVYVLLLCLDWNQTGFVYEPTKLARWCRVTPKRFLALWENVGPNFTEEGGRFFNPRLQEERVKQATNRVKRKQAADTRWHPDAVPDASTSNAHALRLECLSTSTTTSSSSSVVVDGSEPDAALAEMVAPTDVPAVATLIAVAANQGLTAKYGEQPSPLRASHPGSHAAAEAILSAGVPVMWARDAFYTAALGCALERPPQSAKYFLKQVLDAWSAAQARRQAAESPTPSRIAISASDRKVSDIAETKRAFLRGVPA